MSEAEWKGHQITYSPGCFKIANGKNNKITSFYVTQKGLYAQKVPDTGVSLVQTVQENQIFFTPRQVSQAKAIQDLYEMIGRTSYNDL